MRKWMRMHVAAAAAVVMIASIATARATGEAKLTAAQSDKHGTYVADADNRTLYLFTADKQGQDGTTGESTCYDACAQAWPPLIVQGKPQVGDKLDSALVGTIQRTDGKMQVTYGGWPLYYFVQDQGPGQVTGQDKHGFGGEWYLVSTQGKKNEASGT
jgi:predicted lipoprotein with Yx(FWY)xxD motif